MNTRQSWREGGLAYIGAGKSLARLSTPTDTYCIAHSIPSQAPLSPAHPQTCRSRAPPASSGPQPSPDVYAGIETVSDCEYNTAMRLHNQTVPSARASSTACACGAASAPYTARGFRESAVARTWFKPLQQTNTELPDRHTHTQTTQGAHAIAAFDGVGGSGKGLARKALRCSL